MSLSIHSTAPAAPAANLAPAPAVKSTSDTKSSAPSQKQAPSQAAKAPQDTAQISTAAQTALQESKETQAQTAQEAAHGDRQAVKLLAKEIAKKQLRSISANWRFARHAGYAGWSENFPFFTSHPAIPLMFSLEFTIISLP